MGSSRVSNAVVLGAVLLFISIALLRIVLSYKHTAQTFDEPCHVAAGIELLDKGTYSLDPVHPPLSRIAIALPLYLAGERYPILPQSDPMSRNYNVVGNHILYDSGHWLRNLMLGRLGVLPFFVLGGLVVFFWARRIGGNAAAIIALLLYSTTPSILAFSSIAYTDIVAASTQLAAMFAFTLWLEEPSLFRTAGLGFALGLAFLSKLTSLLFVSAAIAFMAAVWFLHRAKPSGPQPSYSLTKLIAAFVFAAVVVWGGYGFSMSRVQATTGITPQNLPSFQHFPRPLRSLATNLVVRDPLLPAPSLLHGVAIAWALNQTASRSYLLAQTKAGGWWYFFLVALAVKLPIPLLILFLLGVIGILREKTRGALLPLVSVAAVLLVTMPTSYQVGTRHVLVAVPLIAIIAGIGCGSFIRPSFRLLPVGLVMALLIWQLVESGTAQSDFLAYFNQLAGPDPSKVLVTGCDLDCGEDLFRLSDILREKHVSRVGLAIWSSADPDRSGLPQNYIPAPTRPPEGWVAVSVRALRVGDVLHTWLPPSYFMQAEQQADSTTKVGKTIRL